MKFTTINEFKKHLIKEGYDNLPSGDYNPNGDLGKNYEDTLLNMQPPTKELDQREINTRYVKLKTKGYDHLQAVAELSMQVGMSPEDLETMLAKDDYSNVTDDPNSFANTFMDQSTNEGILDTETETTYTKKDLTNFLEDIYIYVAHKYNDQGVKTEGKYRNEAEAYVKTYLTDK